MSTEMVKLTIVPEGEAFLPNYSVKIDRFVS